MRSEGGQCTAEIHLKKKSLKRWVYCIEKRQEVENSCEDTAKDKEGLWERIV